MTAGDTHIAVLVVTSAHRLRRRAPRLVPRGHGSVVAVSSWERAAPYLGMAPITVLTDAVTVLHHREQAEEALRASHARFAVVGIRAPLPRWLLALDAVPIASRDVPSYLQEVCVA